MKNPRADAIKRDLMSFGDIQLVKVIVQLFSRGASIFPDKIKGSQISQKMFAKYRCSSIYGSAPSLLA
ncbi:hypothetical protein [Persicitalea jodogahamensis]|uniref:hypothetical protein n=1 Tax=Persicitalea jodogahamensis TaxID=402147 RepID=UPI0016735846|nr:hypothetical protein [Persicitalea jodogahamensis]